MGLSFFHGARVNEDPNGPILIQTAQSAVGALILADATIDHARFPYNKPVLIRGAADYLSVQKLGLAKKHVDAILKQIGTYVYVVNVPVGLTEARTIANIVGSQSDRTGLWALLRCEGMYGRAFKPRIIGVPDHTTSVAATGVMSITATAGGGHYSAGTTCQIGDGTGAKAVPVIAGDQITGFIVQRPWFGYDPIHPPAVTLTDPAGTGTGATAQAQIGATTNPIVAELTALLPMLRAVAFVGGPTTTREDAIAYRNTFTSSRIMPLYVRPEVYDTTQAVNIPQDVAPFFIGVQAAADYSEGFHRSVSNKPIAGIDGVEDQVSYGTDANLLNYNGIGTIIAGDAGGWITWGNRSASDPTRLQVFLCVQRTTDFINEAIESAYRTFNDAPMTQKNVKRLIAAGNDYMATLKAAGAIYDGQVTWDQTQNTDTQLGSGQINLAIRYLVPPPMEDIEALQSYHTGYFAVLRDAFTSANGSASINLTTSIGLAAQGLNG